MCLQTCYVHIYTIEKGDWQFNGQQGSLIDKSAKYYFYDSMPWGVEFSIRLVHRARGDEIYNVVQRFGQIDSYRMSDSETLITSSMERQF